MHWLLMIPWLLNMNLDLMSCPDTLTLAHIFLQSTRVGRVACLCSPVAITFTWLVTKATCKAFEGRVPDQTARLWLLTGENMFARCADSWPTQSCPFHLTWRDKL